MVPGVSKPRQSWQEHRSPTRTAVPWRSLALALALGATVVALSAAWIPHGAPTYQGFPPFAANDATRWSRGYAKIEIPTVDWRPYRVTLRLRAPGDRDRLAVRLGADDQALGEVIVGPEWETHTVDVVVPGSMKPGSRSLQVWSAVEPDARGAGVELVKARPLLASGTGARWMGVGALVGAGVWAASPAARAALGPAASWVAAATRHPGLRWPMLGALVLLAPRLGLLFDSSAEAAHRMTWLAVSLLILAASGRVVRRTIERATGSSGAGVVRAPAFDLVLGTLAWTTALAAVSVVVKRGLAVDGPLPFDLRWAFVALTVVGAWRLRRLEGSWQGLAPSVRDMVSIAAFLFAAGLIVGPHARVLYGYSGDVEHHIYWLHQIEQSGFVPDRYLASGIALDYPLGFHSLAWCLGTITPLSAAALINLAVPLGSLLLIAVILQAVWVATGERHTHWTTPWLVFASLLALGAGLDAAQFSFWQRYEGTARLAAGWVHAVPLALLVDGVLRRRKVSRAIDIAEPVDDVGGVPATNQVLALAMLPASLALAFTFNPALVPVQALLSVGAAVAVFAGSPRARPARFGKALVAGLACAVLLVWGDPYVGGLPDRRFDPATARARAEFTSHLDRETCFSWSCLTDIDATRIGSAMLEPFVTLATPWTAFKGGDFPSLTAPMDGPFQGNLAVLLIPVPLLFLVWTTRHAAWLVLVGGLTVALALDGGLREYLHQVIDPADATLRLLPPYMDRASAIVFNQSIWSLMAVALAIAAASAAGEGGRASLLRIVAGALLALALVPAAVGVWLSVSAVQTAASPPSRADVDGLHRLETAHVPMGDRYLVAAVSRNANGERWIMGNDPSSALYAVATRSPVFLYFLDAGARFAPSDLDAICSQLEAGARPPAALDEAGVRWAVAVSETAERARTALGLKPLCGAPFDRWFPDSTLAGRDGRVSLFRLW